MDDEAFFHATIAGDGEPGLEIGCGSGRLLVPLRRAGLDIDGVDISPDMLDQCRAKGEAAGLDIALYEQAAESLSLPRRYRTIYAPVSSFMLISDAGAARAALQAFRRHLHPGGRVLIPLELPWKTDVGVEPARAGEWRLRRAASDPDDGSRIECWELASYHFEAQLKHSQLRYTVHSGARVVRTETHVLTLRWYEQSQFAALLADAGFDRIAAYRAHSWIPADRDDPSFTFVAYSPPQT